MPGEEIKFSGGEYFGEDYFLMQFAVDKAVLRKIMHQLQEEQGREWKDLQGDERGALRRLALYSGAARDKGLLTEKEADFLIKIGAGKIPPLGSKEREDFNRHLKETGIVPE